MIAGGTFCYEEEHIGCVCGWCELPDEAFEYDEPEEVSE